MRFLLLLVLTIILAKLFIPEIAGPLVDIFSKLLTALSVFLEHLIASVPVT